MRARARALKTKKIDALMLCQVDGRSLLFLASQNNYRETDEPMRVLLEYGLNPNARDARGQTPAHTSVLNMANMRVLLEYGGDINAQDSRGFTPLYATTVAVRYVPPPRSLPRLRHVLCCHASPGMDIGSGSSDKHLVPILEEMLLRGASPFIQAIDGRTPRDVAERYGNKYLCDALDRVSQKTKLP